MPKMKSCASIFADMGNPWSDVNRRPSFVDSPSDLQKKMDAVRRKHSIPSLGYAAELRATDTGEDNAYLDWFWTASKAPPHIEKASETAKGRDEDVERRKRMVSIVRKMKMRGK